MGEGTSVQPKCGESTKATEKNSTKECNGLPNGFNGGSDSDHRDDTGTHLRTGTGGKVQPEK